jgi:hypothetical protein
LKFSGGRRCRDLFLEILGSEVDKNHPGFARKEEMSLSVVFWWLDVAKVVRSEERENCQHRRESL